MPAIGLGAAIQPDIKINGEMEGLISVCVDYVFYVKDIQPPTKNAGELSCP
jgi:hypothetical protein